MSIVQVNITRSVASQEKTVQTMCCWVPFPIATGNSPICPHVSSTVWNSLTKAGFTLTRIGIRVQVCLYRLARVGLFVYSQRYVCHNNDAIIDDKTFWQQPQFLNTESLCSKYVYRTHITVNGCYWNTCKLVFTIIRTRLPGLGLISMWSQPKSGSKTVL